MQLLTNSSLTWNCLIHFYDLMHTKPMQYVQQKVFKQ